MNESESEESLVDTLKDIKLIDSTLFVAFCTAVSYLFGYNFFYYYFARMSLSIRDLNLPITFFIYNLSVILPTIILILFLSISGFYVSQDSFRGRLHGNFSLIIVLFCYILGSWYMFTNVYAKYITIIVSIIYFAMLIYVSRIGYSIPNIIKNLSLDGTPTGKKYKYYVYIYLLIIIFLLSNAFSYTTGNFQGTEFIKGDISGSYQVDLILKNNSNIILPSGNLLLALYYDKNFYVIEKNKTPPDSPIMYVVPEDQIAFAKLNRISARGLFY